jgi:hypothetical protein
MFFLINLAISMGENIDTIGENGVGVRGNGHFGARRCRI